MSPGAPAFPNILGSLPSGSVLPAQNIDTIAPDFETMYAIHSNSNSNRRLPPSTTANGCAQLPRSVGSAKWRGQFEIWKNAYPNRRKNNNYLAVLKLKTVP